MGFLLLVSFLISTLLTVLHTIFAVNMPGVPNLWHLLNTGASFLLVALLFAMIYKYLPDVKITWQNVSVGAGITALLFTIGKFLIGKYLGRTAISGAYGAAGSFVVLIVWVYYSALICFFGAEFTQVYSRRCGTDIRPKSYAVRAGQKPRQNPSAGPSAGR